jgi:hypothetical protein
MRDSLSHLRHTAEYAAGPIKLPYWITSSSVYEKVVELASTRKPLNLAETDHEKVGCFVIAPGIDDSFEP